MSVLGRQVHGGAQLSTVKTCILGLSILKAHSGDRPHLAASGRRRQCCATWRLPTAAPVARLYRWQLWSSDAVAARACAPPAPAHTAVTASVCAGHECSAAGALHSYSMVDELQHQQQQRRDSVTSAAPLGCCTDTHRTSRRVTAPIDNHKTDSKYEAVQDAAPRRRQHGRRSVGSKLSPICSLDSKGISSKVTPVTFREAPVGGQLSVQGLQQQPGVRQRVLPAAQQQPPAVGKHQRGDRLQDMHQPAVSRSSSRCCIKC